MAERWLVICHEATNSGAPRMLLEVLRGVQLARGPGWSCEILACRGGVLLPEFARLGPVHVLAHPWAEKRSLLGGLFRKFIDRPWFQPRRFAAWLRLHREAKFDLVYNNTATNGYVVSAIRNLGSPILTHVHELGYSMRRFNTPLALAQTLENTDRFLAVSPAVAADLVECGASRDQITDFPNFLAALPLEPTATMRAGWRESRNLPADAYVVTGCGHIDWVKGTDLFVEAAAAFVSLTRKKLHFVWLGSETDRHFARQVRRRVQHHNLKDLVRFVGAVSDAMPWFAASDLVAVTSRFESFSMVALEAGGLGRPVVGFAEARGIAGLLGDDPRFLVPRLAPSAMAAVWLELMENPEGAAAHGQRLRGAIAAEFLAGPRIRQISAIADELVEAERGKG